MPEYLIDAYSMATYWVTAATEEEAVEEVKGQTRGLDLQIQVGRKTSVILIDVTSRDDDPEVVDVRDDDGFDDDGEHPE
ncbi:hypothetical protein [Aliirhizobium cellulosilyticum]|uniref:Ni,Fe-hydrogenase maturation factor n=1 Tax=Aliirhizobium cellulosilyticum TaxID=393664 RepID=A0A7W6TGW8_9HYPH|nr:hypothetical protein [Rhizobium cellulosilyticum]MBB4349300.1 Ni,Fe-hydrogenase maturation factor [Rhizobium cellulosilyticum]MBB4412478.1 Ni,Fe-hydrogenase maturation factor [Rhizobium cellulosilyticum]MBB4447110.1 Ni,Fe-hydrogenase maturation factor [Rhizobium cellulosilyticum]